jgi:hypothetical protein
MHRITFYDPGRRVKNLIIGKDLFAQKQTLIEKIIVNKKGKDN